MWSAQSGVDLKTIGFFTLVGTPYTLKFLWAPIVDAVDIPILSRLLGRRRGWLVFSQLLLMAAIVFLAFCDPAISPWTVAFGALLVATASATQDIVIDAFRVESLDKSEQAAGMASYVAAYRIGMLASTVGVLYLVAAFETVRLRDDGRLEPELHRHGRAGADRDRHHHRRHRAAAIRRRGGGACRRKEFGDAGGAGRLSAPSPIS